MRSYLLEVGSTIPVITNTDQCVYTSQYTQIRKVFPEETPRRLSSLAISKEGARGSQFFVQYCGQLGSYIYTKQLVFQRLVQIPRAASFVEYPSPRPSRTSIRKIVYDPYGILCSLKL